jgi:hypothetical protein
MVGMHVRDDDTQHGQTAQRRLEHLIPECLDLVAGHTAINYRPALAAIDLVAQQPQVDVIQRERQRHAHPADAIGHVSGCAWRGKLVAKRVIQFLLVGIHVSLLRLLMPARVGGAPAESLLAAVPMGKKIPCERWAWAMYYGIMLR